MGKRSKRPLTTIQIHTDQIPKIAAIADRLDVPRGQALRWIIDTVDADSFLPYRPLESTVAGSHQDAVSSTNEYVAAQGK